MITGALISLLSPVCDLYHRCQALLSCRNGDCDQHVTYLELRVFLFAPPSFDEAAPRGADDVVDFSGFAGEAKKLVILDC